LDTIDDLLWIHYGDEMVALLTEDTFVPATWQSARRDQAQSRTVAVRGRIPRNAPPTVLPSGKEVEPADVKKRGR
jgi:hypothetical protein